MPSEAEAIQERGTWQWGLEIDGLDELYIESCTPPEVEAVTRIRGQAGRQMNVPIPTGKMTVADMVLNKVMPANESDQWAWNLLMRAIDEPVNDVVFDFVLVEYDQGGDSGRVIDRTHYTGFVQKVVPGERSASEDEEHVVEEVTIKITAVPRKS